MKTKNLPARILISLLLTFFLINLIQAQPTEKFIKIMVSPDHTDWTYKLNEKANFKVTITQSGEPVAVTNVRYALMPEKLPKEKDR